MLGEGSKMVIIFFFKTWHQKRICKTITAAIQHHHIVTLVAYMEGKKLLIGVEPYSLKKINGQDCFYCYDFIEKNIIKIDMKNILYANDTKASFVPRFT